MEGKTQQTSAAMAGMSVRSGQEWMCRGGHAHFLLLGYSAVRAIL